MAEVKTLYKCIVCGKAWSSSQSLRAHVKVHRREGYARTGIVVKSELWDWFKRYCEEHNTTTCHLFNALLEMARKGTEGGVITLGAQNPVILQLNQTFLGRPRSGYKVPVGAAQAGQMLSSGFSAGLGPGERKCVMCGGPGVYASFQPAWGHRPSARWFCEKCRPRR